MGNLEDILKSFNPISLKDMDTVKLMNRTETKYVFAAADLPEILNDLSKHYQVLEIEGVKTSSYSTLYFDTEELKFYAEHHNGRLSRQKVRIRKYVNTNQAFVEVKTKNNKGRSVKRRVPEKDLTPDLSENALKFIKECVDLGGAEVSAKLWNTYKRITLVDLLGKERVTIDLDLEFDNKKNKAHAREIIIAEIKQEKYNVRSPYIQKMRSLHIRPMRMSKYCIGTILLRGGLKVNSAVEGIKINRFKQKLLIIEKLKNGSSQ